MFQLRNFLLLFLLFILIVGGTIFFALNLRPVSTDKTQSILEISQGMSFNQIVNQLHDKGLIRSSKIFKAFALLSGQAHQFKPGEYFLSPNLSSKEIINYLTNGPKEISITIIPGRTLKEIDDLLSSSGVIKKGDLIGLSVNEVFSVDQDKYFFLKDKKTLEGFLLPDTYRFLPGETAKTVALKILDNFEAKALQSFKKGASINVKEDFDYKTLILASLLEKEIPVYEDQRIAAGIFQKRLKIGMPLQIDACILYAKCDGRFINCSTLQKEDFKIDSPYNTYLNKGLVPTPISNPSSSTIEAAANPIPSDYLYYLAKPKTNQTIFSKTFEEHNRNRYQYLLNN
ncbi:MAG: endolytic transglycosylase MltG [Candidatus Paceibacterota bacterium]|jgi:UPF0755 protein